MVVKERERDITFNFLFAQTVSDVELNKNERSEDQNSASRVLMGSQEKTKIQSVCNGFFSRQKLTKSVQ